jgi:hypothetical protein
MADRRWRASAEERAEGELVNETLTLQDDAEAADRAALQTQIDELHKELFFSFNGVDDGTVVRVSADGTRNRFNLSEELRELEFQRDGPSRLRQDTCGGICLEHVDAGTPGTLCCAKCGTTCHTKCVLIELRKDDTPCPSCRYNMVTGAATADQLRQERGFANDRATAALDVADAAAAAAAAGGGAAAAVRLSPFRLALPRSDLILCWFVLFFRRAAEQRRRCCAAFLRAFLTGRRRHTWTSATTRSPT